MAKGYEVVADKLNIRAEPKVKSEDLGDLVKGDILIAPEGWVPILMEDDSIAWVSEEFVQPCELMDEPVEAPEPFPEGKVIYQRDMIILFGTPSNSAPYLVTMDFREFKDAFAHVKDWTGKPWSCRIYGHELTEKPLRQAFRNLVDRGHAGELMTFDGCFCIRKMSGGNSWSMHSWGAADDFNARTNAYGDKPTLSMGFVACFEDVGFTWGGRWRIPDGMHFQIPKI